MILSDKYNFNSFIFVTIFHRGISFLFTFLFAFNSFTISAQSYQDSLQAAVKLREAGKMKEAIGMLSLIHKAHPNDLNTTWYYAQSSFLAGENELSFSLYEAAIRIQPNNIAIQLDYGKTLANSAELDKAEWMLNNILEKDKNNAEAWLYLGRVYYWQGRYKEAEKLLNNLVRNTNSKSEARKLLAQLHSDIAPWLQFQTSLAHDDQPLNILTTGEKGGWYVSSLLNLDFEMQFPLVRTSKNDNYLFQGFKAGNKFQFRKASTNLYLAAGIFNNSKAGKLFMTGDLRIEKSLSKKLVFTAEAQRKPYYFTRGSLDTALMENHFSASLAWNKPERWNGKLNFEHGIFTSDDESVSAFSGWIFAPQIKWGKWDLHFGYGYNYSNATVNHYESSKSIESIVNSGNTTAAVEGVYNPYFTPKEQQIHSVLASLNAQISKSLRLKVNGNVGFYATTLYPYLYLQQDLDGNYQMVRGFESTRFIPYEMKASLDWKLSPSLLFVTELNYFHTIYYSGEMIRLSLKKTF